MWICVIYISPVYVWQATNPKTYDRKWKALEENECWHILNSLAENQSSRLPSSGGKQTTEGSPSVKQTPQGTKRFFFFFRSDQILKIAAIPQIRGEIYKIGYKYMQIKFPSYFGLKIKNSNLADIYDIKGRRCFTGLYQEEKSASYDEQG